MTKDTTTDVRDRHCFESELNLKDCTLSLIMPVKGGRLVINSLPDFPPIFCTQNGCDELAEYLVSIYLNSGDKLDCFQCEVHKEKLISLSEAEIPVEITH